MNVVQVSDEVIDDIAERIAKKLKDEDCISKKQALEMFAKCCKANCVWLDEGHIFVPGEGDHCKCCIMGEAYDIIESMSGIGGSNGKKKES